MRSRWAVEVQPLFDEIQGCEGAVQLLTFVRDRSLREAGAVEVYDSLDGPACTLPPAWCRRTRRPSQVYRLGHRASGRSTRLRPG